jgi:hypothetical protein
VGQVTASVLAPTAAVPATTTTTVTTAPGLTATLPMAGAQLTAGTSSAQVTKKPSTLLSGLAAVDLAHAGGVA